MFLASVRNVKESSDKPLYKSTSKEPTTSNLSLCTIKIKFYQNQNKTESINGPAQKKIATFLM